MQDIDGKNPLTSSAVSVILLLMNESVKKSFLINCLFAASIAGIIYLVFRFCIPLLAPFLFAFIVTALISPLIDLLNRKVRIPKKVSAIVLVTISYLVLAGILTLIGNGVYRWASNANGWFQTVFVPGVLKISKNLSVWLKGIDSGLVPYLQTMRDSLISTIGAKVSSVSAGILSSLAGSLPAFLIGVIFSVVATYFMATDTDRIKEFIATRQSEDTYKTLSAAYLSLKTTLGRYIRAYLLIMLIMFLELTLGLFIAGIKRFVLYALLVAIFDILPVLGSSMILLPWSLILLLTGDIKRGAIMFVVYVVVVVVRQFIEPKIVGEHVGLHPLITLIAMYVGAKLFGGIGLFGLPMCCAVLVQLEHAGFLNLFPKRRDLYKSAS